MNGISPDEEGGGCSLSPPVLKGEVDTPSRKRKAEEEIADSQDEDEEDSEGEFLWDGLLDGGEEEHKDQHEEQAQDEDTLPKE